MPILLKGNGKPNLILVYVDHTKVLSADSSHIEDVVSRFKSQYTMQDTGDLEHYLGITIVRDIYLIKLIIRLHMHRMWCPETAICCRT